MNIHLIERLIAESDNRNKGFDYDMLGNGKKCVLIIQARLLGKTLHHKMCFISFDRNIYLIFDLINPFTSNRFMVRGPRNKIPSVVKFKCR